METDAKGFFTEAVGFVLRNEGGFVNNPADPGDATNFGITLATLSAWRGVSASVKDVQALTAKDATTIYYARYWCPLSLSLLTKASCATAIFDAAVLFGPGASALCCQKALVRTNYTLQIDGHMGLQTITALNTVRPDMFLKAFTDCLLTRVASIIDSRPASTVFREGWDSRIKRYLDL